MNKKLSLVMALTVAAVSLGVVGSGGQQAKADYDDGAYCYDNTWGDVVCAEDWVAEAILNASWEYGVDEYTMFALAACENNFLWWPVGPYGELGIYQFLPDTFYWLSNGEGDPQNVWDASYTTAHAISDGWGWLWTCWWRI